MCQGHFTVTSALGGESGGFFSDFIYLFLERGEGREKDRGREGGREGKKHQCVVASRVPPTGDLASNPGMCPAQELNQDPLVRRLALSPLSHSSQGWEKSLF